MWGRKCSLFPEHLISLPLGSSWFHPFVIYIHYIICQSKDYVYGLMITLACLPGLVLTALSWTYIILPPSGQWIICNKAIPSQKDTHTSGALNLNFRIYLQGGFNQVCMNILHFLFGLCVLTTCCIKIVIDSMIQEWCMHEGQYGSKETTFWNEMLCLKFIYIYFW